MSTNMTQFSIGDYIAIAIVPVIMLAGWLIAIYHADRHPGWRHKAPDQAEQAMIGPGGIRLGRAVPGPLPVPVQPASPEVKQDPVATDVRH